MKETKKLQGIEKMRARLQAMEDRADELIEKGDDMTGAERFELLSLVNVSLHTSGKIESLYSIDSCAACEFCQKMISAAACNPLMICGACYAARDSWKEAAWRRHKLNTRILSTVLFTVDELSRLPLPAYCNVRFNEDGDTVNAIMAQNYLRIVKAFPHARFGYFFKNAPAVAAGLQAEEYTDREALPENARFIQSSIFIGFAARATWFADAVFTVYPDAATTAAAIENGAHACNGKKCMDCGFRCYLMQRRENALQIAELLRCSNAARKVVMDAYNARRAAIAAA